LSEPVAAAGEIEMAVSSSLNCFKANYFNRQGCFPAFCETEIHNCFPVPVPVCIDEQKPQSALAPIEIFAAVARVRKGPLS
jgi:hypothetical protein